MTPTLTTSRLVLKPYYAGMVTDDHVKWLNDPDVVRYSEQRHKRHTLESVHQYVNDIATTVGSHLWGIYLMAVADNDPESCNAIKPTLIGTISAHTDAPNGVANIGIMIGEKSQWGKSYGKEAWSAVCNWLFERGIRKIEMGCHFENRAMRKLAISCGMHMEAVRHDHFVVDGKPQHLLLYAKMKPESVQVSLESVATQPIRECHSQDSA